MLAWCDVAKFYGLDIMKSEKNGLFQKALDMVTGVENILKEHAGTKELLPSQKRRLRELQLPNGRYG